MKFAFYLAFALGIILLPESASGHVVDYARSQDCQIHLTDNSNLQWVDFNGDWNQKKNFIHYAGVEAHMDMHHPLFSYFPITTEAHTDIQIFTFYCPPKDKFTNHTYLPPPLNI